MGSTIRANDTLQITAAQGFPESLDVEQHLRIPYRTEDFAELEFRFTGKEGIRVFQQAPVQNFLVENKPTAGKERHIYWGHVEFTKVEHDYATRVTSGIFRITKIFSPEEMRIAPKVVGLDPRKDFFAEPL